jgi:hypothetical protein
VLKGLVGVTTDKGGVEEANSFDDDIGAAMSLGWGGKGGQYVEQVV